MFTSYEFNQESHGQSLCAMQEPPLPTFIAAQWIAYQEHLQRVYENTCHISGKLPTPLEYIPCPFPDSPISLACKKWCIEVSPPRTSLFHQTRTPHHCRRWGPRFQRARRSRWRSWRDDLPDPACSYYAPIVQTHLWLGDLLYFLRPPQPAAGCIWRRYR